MKMRCISVKHTMILIFVAFSSLALSSQSSAQKIGPSNPGNELGPGRDTSKDPILSPDEERVQEYLDPPIIIESQDYGPRENPAEPRKNERKRVDSPTLKLEKEDKGLPVHSVRNELGFQQDLIDQIEKLGSGKKQPTGAFYDRVFRKLYNEREALIRSAGKETNSNVRSIQLEQALELSKTIDKVSRPSSAKNNEFRRWNPVSDAWSESINRNTFREIDSANRIINRPDRDAAYRQLDRLLQSQRTAERFKKQRDKVRAEFFESGVFEKVYSKDGRNFYEKEFQVADQKYQALVDYIKDYEKALMRKWPNSPKRPKAAINKKKAGELEMPEIGPLPEVIGAPQAPGPIDFP